MWISGTFQASPPENILYKNSTHKKSKQNIDTIKSNKSLFPTGSQFDTLIPTSLRRSGNRQQLCLHLHLFKETTSEQGIQSRNVPTKLPSMNKTWAYKSMAGLWLTEEIKNKITISSTVKDSCSCSCFGSCFCSC